MKIYTRAGDGGKTSLFGGKAVAKTDQRLQAVGSIDETNALIGVILAEHDLPETIRKHLGDVQQLLFALGADLATPSDHAGNILRTDPKATQTIETWIDELTATLPPLSRFILPGGSRSAALLHQARTVCRRAERWIVALGESTPISPGIVPVVNRLSDYLFTAARAVNQATGKAEETVRIPREPTE